MATAAQRAARDTQLKLKFERKLKPKINKILNEVARDVAGAISNNGVVAALSVGTRAAEIEAVLITHYEDVGKIFSRQLTNRLPNPVSVTGAERTIIEAELTQVYKQRASAQAQRIASTTINNVQRSVASQLAVAGVDASDTRTLGRNVGAQLSKHFGKRATGIACVETQHSAEVAKETEIQVVTPNTATPTKEWVSQGDNRVRDAHLSADGQVVAVNQPFIVKGERLMYPGDPAGSPGNIINCRCSAQVDEGEIISQRGA
jgi:uncharacterized protein with gpF-like domain